MTSLTCDQCESQLFEFHEGQLAPEQAARVDEHLQDCDACSRLLADIWQMSLVSTRWQDESALKWNRGEHFESRRWQLPQLTAVAASVLAVVLVLTDTHITRTEDGFRLRVGRDAYVTSDELARFGETVKTDQAAVIDQRFQRLTTQQAASNQLLLRSVLDTSREERKEDFSTLVSYLNATQAKRYQQTEEELRYLMASQIEDEKDIQQLTDAFSRINLQRGNDM